MDTAPHQPAPSRGRPSLARHSNGRCVRRTPRAPRDSRGSRWLLASTGLMLLVVAIVMMACGAQPSRAQTVRPGRPPARLRLPAPDGRALGEGAVFWLPRSQSGAEQLVFMVGSGPIVSR